MLTAAGADEALAVTVVDVAQNAAADHRRRELATRADLEPKHLGACDRLPRPLIVGLGLQFAAISVNLVALNLTIVFLPAVPELAFWAVFASVLACGVSTACRACEWNGSERATF